MLNPTAETPQTKGRWSPGSKVANRFLVRTFIGSGPLGEVYAAVDETTDTVVALRIVADALAAEPPIVAAYVAGANRAGGLSGDGVVETLAMLREPLLSASQLIEGPSLADYIEEYGALPFDIAIELFHSMVGILMPLHDRGLAHGTLSPRNILLERSSERLVPRLKGFEFAPVFAAAPQLNAQDDPYRCPEPSADDAQSQKLADIYAVGACLYETVSGRAPTDASDFAKLQERVPGLSDELFAVVRQSTQADPKKRFQALRAIHNILDALRNEGAHNQSSPERPEAGDVIGDQYVIESLLGEGGMARVYLATDKALGTRVALKLLNATCLSEPQVVERFLAEASIQAKLVHPEPHPNIVAVHRVFNETPIGFVMEYVDGFTLEDLLENPAKFGPRLGIGTALTEESLIDIFAQVSDGLHHAHKNRIIHRDLKPSNILLSRLADGGISAKLMDFGISKQLDQPKTRTNLVLGTLGYIAPELFVSAKDASPSSDIYAIGCCIFESLVGDVPFPVSGGMRSLAFRVYNEQAPRPSALGITVRPELETLIAMMLAKKPEERPESGLWLRDRLRALQAGAGDTELAAAVARNSMGGETLPGSGLSSPGRTSPGLMTDSSGLVVVPPRQRSVLPIVLIAVGAVLAVGLVLFFVLNGNEEPQADAAEEKPPAAVPKDEPTQQEPKVDETAGNTVLPASVVLGADELLAQAREEAEAGNTKRAIELYEEAIKEQEKSGEDKVSSNTLEEVADLYVAAATEVSDDPETKDDEVTTSEEQAELLASASVYMGRAAKQKGDFNLFMKKAAIDQDRGDAAAAASALQEAIEVAPEGEVKDEAEKQLSRLEKAYAEGADDEADEKDDDDKSRSRIPMGPLPPNMIEVWIESKPDGAKVSSNGRRLGRTPLIKRLPKTTGELKFTLKRSGRYDEVVRVNGAAGGKFTVRMSYRPRKID